MKLASIFKKKRFIILLVIILALIIFRIMLPGIVKKYVNKTLAELPGYSGQVLDIDIGLLRGAYEIHGLTLDKIESNVKVPFVEIDNIDISVEWKSLFRGRIVSEIYLESPSVHFVVEDQEAEDNPEIEDWTQVVLDLVPISINKFEIEKGSFAFVKVQSDANLELEINEIQLSASNLQNIVDDEVKLPSTLHAQGQSIGNGQLKIDGEMNMLKEIPDVDIAMSIENSNAIALNEFIENYTSLKLVNGQFSLFSEVAIADGYLKSYLKPVFKDTELEDENQNVFTKLKEGVVNLVESVLKNNETENVVSKIPIEGDLKDSDVKVWCSIYSLFKNAWFKALRSEIDETIEYKDAEALESK